MTPATQTDAQQEGEISWTLIKLYMRLVQDTLSCFHLFSTYELDTFNFVLQRQEINYGRNCRADTRKRGSTGLYALFSLIKYSLYFKKKKNLCSAS